MCTAQLAQALHVSTYHLELLINGKGRVTVGTAYRLGRFFGTGPELWIDLQTFYEHEAINHTC